MASPLDAGALRARIRAGERLTGTFVGLGSPTVAEIAAISGADFIVLDCEHGGGGEEQVGPTVTAAGGYGLPTVVRVDEGTQARIGRALDAGAAGIMVPRVQSAEEAERVVRMMHYPPRGTRGVASYNRSARWGKNPDALIKPASHVGIIQIETRGALDELEAIASIDGVDVLFVGPLDLSFALGLPRQWEHPQFVDALRSVVAAARKYGKTPGILGADPAAAARYAELGYTFIPVGSDSTLMLAAFESAFASTRVALGGAQ